MKKISGFGIQDFAVTCKAEMLRGHERAYSESKPILDKAVCILLAAGGKLPDVQTALDAYWELAGDPKYLYSEDPAVNQALRMAAGGASMLLLLAIAKERM
jgi:hypothetical protein